MTLQLVDRSVRRPQGIIEDVLIKVDKFYFPVDFIVIDTEPEHNVGSQIPVILGRPFLATANALKNCRMGVMKISFGNMIVELNIFDINNQPLDYDEVHPVCLIEEITDEAENEFSLEDPEVECFTQDENDLDLDRLLGQDDVLYEDSLEDLEIECFAPSRGDLYIGELLQQTRTMYEPSIEDPEMECFAQHGEDMDYEGFLEPARGVGESSLADTVLKSFGQLGYDVDWDELVEQAEAILDPVLELQSECGKTTKLSSFTPYSSVVELHELIYESKWVGPIHVWPRWPSVTMGRKKDNELFQTRVQKGWQGCIHNSKLKAITRNDHFLPPFIDPLVTRSAGYSYYCVFNGYSSYNHVTLDPGKKENTTLISVLGAFAYCHRPSGSCNAPVVDSLAEDCKLSACGRQPITTFSFCCHLIWFSYFVFVVIVFFRKSIYRSSLGERSPTLHSTFAAHLVLYPNTLGTICHFSLGVG
jgi:hypothetical protein